MSYPKQKNVFLNGALAVAFGGAAAVASIPAALSAEPTSRGDAGRLEEIVVTATRREASLQDVPMAISAVDESQITERGLDGILDLARFVPGLEYSEIGAGQRNGANITIRGIANTRFFSSQDDGVASLTTGFYVNDVAMMPADPNLYDVKRVEILKGPQGTLFGQASMGGTVRVILNSPDLKDFDANAAVSYSSTTGGDPSSSLDAMVNIPISTDTLAVRLVGSLRDDGGYVDWYPAPLNTLVPRGRSTHPYVQSANDGTLEAARAEVLWKPTERWDISPSIFYQKTSVDHDNAYDRNLDQGLMQNRFLEETRGVSLTVGALSATYRFDSFDLISVTAYSDRQYDAAQDLTYLTGLIYGLNTDESLPSVMPFIFDYQTEIFSQEFRLQGTHEFDSRGSLDWVVGASYLKEDRDSRGDWKNALWNINADNGNAIANAESRFISFIDTATYENLSIFADVTWNLGAWSFAAGLRGFDQSHEAERHLNGDAVGNADAEILGEASETGTVPRASVAYEFSPNLNTYAAYSEGFRIGGPASAGILLDSPECQDALAKAGLTGNTGEFVSDSVANYELGLKSLFNDATTRVNVAVFYIDWTDLQTGVELNRFNPACSNIITTNLGAAESKGFELEVDQSFSSGVSVGGRLALTDAEISDAPSGTTFSEGQPLGGVAKWTGSAYLAYEQQISSDFIGTMRIDWAYRDSMVGPNFSDADDPFVQNDAYSVVNLRFGVEHNRWGLVLYMDNALNEIGELGAGQLPGESFTDRVQITRPRTIGVRLTGRL